MKKILFILLLIYVKQINAQSSCFTLAGNNYPAGNNPTAIITADFNKDGKADLAVTNFTSNNVSIMLGNGIGGFGSAINFMLPTTNPEPLFLCTADFDEDGNLDIATANSNINNVSVLMGTGSGTGLISSISNYPTPGMPYAICAADFNGDGHIDLAEANGNVNSISILLGAGTGSFGVPTSFAVGTNPYGICTGDFNKDGKIDLAVANDAGSVSILINTIASATVTPTFTTSATLSGSYSNPHSIISADINLDGNLDLSVANETSGTVSTLFGTGTGTFNTGPGGTISPTSTSSPRCIISADFNGDGHPDIASADYGSTSPYYASILLNSFGPGQNINLGAAQNPHGICSGDFNGDGAPDLAIANETSNDVTVLLNGYPTVKISGDSAVCSGIATTLTASGANVGSFTWSANAGGVTTATVAVTPIAPTTSYTVTNQNAACSYTASAVVTITVSPTPSITIAGAPPLYVCPGTTSTLTASGANTYTWSTGDTASTIVVSPIINAYYSISGTNTVGCVGAASTNIFVNLNPVLTINSPTICLGSTAIISVNGASGYNITANGMPPYNYFSLDSMGYSIPKHVAFTPTVTTTFSVTGISGATGCRTNDTTVVTVNPLPDVQINGMNDGTSNVCAGSSAVLNASGANTYTWSTSVVATHIVVIPTAGELYNVIGADIRGCSNSTTLIFNINALPNVTVNSATVCAGTPVTLLAQGASTYTWSNSALTNSISVSPTASTSYTVTATDVNTCTNTAVATISAPVNPVPTICMVTTDSISSYNYNIVYWTNTDYPNADSFIVYRNNASNYLRLGAVSKDSSHFTDTYRNIPIGGGGDAGDPNSTSYRYTLAVRDTCGNISPQSAYHQTTNVYVNGSNIDWNDYTVNAVPALGYDVYWDSLGNNNFVIFQSGLSSLQTNVPSFASYPNQNFRVDPILSYTCNIHQRLAGGNNNPFAVRQRSHSNTSRQATTGINLVASNSQPLLIYPNPANNNINISCAGITSKTVITMYDATGRVVLQQTCADGNQHQLIDIQSIQTGMYFIEVGGARKIITVTK